MWLQFGDRAVRAEHVVKASLLTRETDESACRVHVGLCDGSTLDLVGEDARLFWRWVEGTRVRLKLYDRDFD